MNTADATNPTTMTGGCLCGAVRYRVTATPAQFYFCHCSQCRKITGSAFAANVLCPDGELEWLQGEGHVRRFDLPGRAFTKVFCEQCGSGLPWRGASGSGLYMPAGSLDADPPLAPGEHIFWAEHADWLAMYDDLPRTSGFPAGGANAG